MRQDISPLEMSCLNCSQLTLIVTDTTSVTFETDVLYLQMQGNTSSDSTSSSYRAGIIGCEDDKVCPVCQSPYAPPRKTYIRTTKDVLASVKHFRDKKQEYFICLSLDSSQSLIARRVVTIGLLDSTLVHPREVFAGPLTDRAASVVIVHNHPSGDPSPSEQDIQTTQQLVAAAYLLGLALHDHIILTKNRFYSFKSRQLLL